MNSVYAFTAAALMAAQLSSQPAAIVPAVIAPVATYPTPMLRAGTPVQLRMTTELTTKGKHLKVGDRFSLEVGDPVLLNGQVVIPVGSNAVGEVTSVRNKGMWGKSGNIETRLLYVMAGDRRVRISGSVADKGAKAGGGALATSAIVFLPAGFFMTGTSAVVPIGTRVPALIEEDVPVVFSQPAPIAATVPVPVAAQPALTPAVTSAGAAAQVQVASMPK